MTLPPIRRHLLLSAAGLAAAALARPALGQPARPGAVANPTPGWPSQNLRLIVPFTPGGSNDNLARPVADGLTQSLGRPMIVENRAGAAGSIGAAVVANAPPDGHTLLIASSSFATSSTVRRTSFDALESFDPVARLAVTPMIVVTKPNSPFRDVGQLVTFARANPGQLQYGMAGLGGVGHFVQEAFNLAANLRMEAIPYAGMAPAQTDLAGGRIDFLMTTVASVRGLIEAGTIPVIGVTSGQRWPTLPNVPSIQESTGIPFDIITWFGILAPRGVPAPVLARLNTEINKVVNTDNYKRFLETEGAAAAPLSVPEFRDALRADIMRWRKVAADAKISLE